jgi:transmembrane sensor
MPTKLDPVVEAAIDWSVKLRFNQADAEVWARFQRWRNADAAHERAWRRMEALHADFPGQAPGSMTADTLSTLHQRRVDGRRRAMKLFAGVGVLAGTTALLREFMPWQRAVADYSTAYGERRGWTLEDGTRVVLNTDSAIDVRFSAQERRIDLLRGEIQVTTGADAGVAARRGFRVATPAGGLVPVGTAFLVRLAERSTQLTVQSGAVELRPRHAALMRIAQAGESWTLQADEAYRDRPGKIAAGGWLRGTLVVEDLPLGELLAELGRYRAWHLRCDPAVAGLRITAVVHLDDLDRALDFLAGSHGLQLRRFTPFLVSVGPRARA